ncbi:MAG: response regulator [Prolixibacteraceae bacterium]|nr:response regulator [Prolixibacteraceae bacterium]
MISRLSIIVIIILSSFSVDAFPAKFYSINSKFGISIRAANDICEDDNGFIWASSRTGILRLTDDNYRFYQLPFETADVITVKLIYKNSNLYAYTNNGQIFYYNTIYDRFDFMVSLRKETGDNELVLSNILIDDFNIIWMATTFGFYKYENSSLELIRKISDKIYSTIWFDNSNILIAEPKGIWLFNINSKKFEQIHVNSSNIPYEYSSLYYDVYRNNLWMGTLSDGLFQYNFTTDSCSSKFDSFTTTQPILAIEANTDSTLLVGIDGQGIWELNKYKTQVVNVYKESTYDPMSLRGNGVYEIFRDKNNRIWVCTISGGVSFFDQDSPLVNQITHQNFNPNSLINNDVNSIIEDREGKLWFATNNGISCWNTIYDTWKHFYYNILKQAQVFLSICEDDQGRIWAGTYASGVYVIDGKTGEELAHYEQSNKRSSEFTDYIFAIYKDSEGDIWLGGVNGNFACYSSKENNFRIYSNEPINSFYELEPGQILLGCVYGISVLNKETGEIKKLVEDLFVNDLFVNGDIIWMCTSGDGLVRYDYKKGTIENFTTTSGLPSNFINSIYSTSDDDFLWLGTENGLCRFEPQKNKVLTYSSINPLSGISFNIGSPFMLKNKQLAWGTNKGAIFFNPKLMEESPVDGRIYLQDIVISGSSVREIPDFNLNTPVDSLQLLQLNYSQNNLSLDLIPIGAPAGTKFSWKFEGFDNNWSTPTDNRTITYTNIPSGNFQLKIRLLDSSLTQTLAERTLNIKMIPPVWRASWFIILIIILLIGVITLIQLFYINRLKRIHTEEKVRFFTNTAHDIRTSLTLIKAPIEELYKEKNISGVGRKFLHLANEQAQRLTAVVTQLMDFQKVDIGKETISYTMVNISDLISNRILMFESFAKKNNVTLLYDSVGEHNTTAVDIQKIEKIIDNLISNAIKYSHPNELVQINLNCTKNKWILQVKDNGIGISKKAQRMLFKEFYRGDNANNSKIVGSGIGLLLARKYVTMHKGSISCESQKNVGSTFRVEIPIRKLAMQTKLTPDTFNINSPTSIRSSHYLKQIPEIDKNKTSLHDMKILIVEDNKDLLHFLNNTLSREFKILSAEDGIAAWEIIPKQQPDLVITDVMMPKMNGFELCQLIKSTFETSHIPVIILTALNEKDEQLHGLGLGADDYFTKPFDMNILVQRIKSIIINREAVRKKVLKTIGNGSLEPILINNHNNDFLQNALKIVQENIANAKFNKDDFASKMNISPSLLYKKLKSLTNQSPSEFIKNIRLEYAMELLKVNNQTITEISELCGFTNIGYFSSSFKKQFGKSPREIFH